MGVVHTLLLLGTVNVGSVGLTAMSASAESGNQVYGLETIVDLALAKNPVVSLAEGTIEQQKGQQTAAGAYPNPTIASLGGHGNLRDIGQVPIGPMLDRQGVTEYNVTVGQPVEWPALRAARQRVADLGLATANVGM
ncbi:MAG TPA: hypothetical protein DDY39_04785, partial [Nitrospira sp.]|nr:hypothetical protein [Nitrospira sp.]